VARALGVLVTALLTALPRPAPAHELARSLSNLQVRGAVVEGWHLFDLLAFRGADADGNRTVSYEELDAAMPAVYETVKAHLILRGPEAPVRTEVRSYSIVQDGHILRLEMTYTFDRPVTALEVVSNLPLALRPQHLHFVSVRTGGALREAVLDARQPSVTFSSAESAGTLATVRRFLVLGIEHILTGYDHLAFLMSLLVATTTARSLIGIVTSFTVAHSVTLALATFGLVVLPSRFVESIIALSIAYVAIESLLQKRPWPGTASPSSSGCSTDSASLASCARWSCRGRSWRSPCSRSTPESRSDRCCSCWRCIPS
jgi:hypothetical protein